MLGKPQWFKRRKYGGWGFFPACWQGWAYVAVMLATLVLIRALPFGNDTVGFWLLVVWAVIFSADAVHIVVAMPKDEREVIHEAKAERNAMWAMIAILAGGVAYQVASSGQSGIGAIDPVIIAALAVGIIVKAATNVYLESAG